METGGDGNVTSQTDVLGDATTYAYHALNQVPSARTTPTTFQ